ncbi:M48 family metalloprotease [Scleromatobacter humisilvae]|uniref:M48 family metalloprotease n=1 Tax=Scleromatobacter humisilvae TaxID=2897159 RepID=A0A9X1YQE8_9BURK|nr:M48 family metalloprotease [Scleromatobacter humisilvae]MCK9689605.1 M48 family metalloprotease [Scleromatobacter humisilvae]
MRPKFATLAAAACLALNLFTMSAAPAAPLNLPALGEAEGDEFSIDDEKKVGDQIMSQILPDPAVIDDPVLYQYLMSIFGPLHQAALKLGNISPEQEEKLAWQPFLVDDTEFNAFALPGGYMGVNLGLIAQADTRDEMASVLGHELSHITQRHIARSMVANKHQSIVSMAAMLIGLLASVKSKNGDVPMAVIQGSQAAAATAQLTFSRQMETEADTFGQEVMTEAGFSPSGMADMFGKLETVSRLNDSNQYPWLRSHPLTIERIAAARLRAREGAPQDPAKSHITEHSLMKARARALMDTSDVALRRMQGQARLNAPLTDAERLGILYGGALASMELRDFPSAQTMLAKADEVMAQHAALVAQQENAPPLPPAPPAQVVVTPHVYPIEPEVAHDFALLRVEGAVAKHSAPEIVAAVDALGNDRSRPGTMARANGAIARAAARDPSAGAALQQCVESLQTWVAERPRDVLAWTLLSQCAEPLGQKLRAIRAEAEAHAAQGDLMGAIDRLRAGQKLTRTGRVDFVEASIIDARLRELEAIRRQLIKDNHGRDPNQP